MPIAKYRNTAIAKSGVALFSDLRLQALQESAEAFDKDYKEKSEKPHAYWQALTAGVSPPSNNTMLIAIQNNQAVGVVYGFNKMKGSGSFEGMWVAQQSREQEIASKLLKAVWQWTKDSGISTPAHLECPGQSSSSKSLPKIWFSAK